MVLPYNYTNFCNPTMASSTSFEFIKNFYTRPEILIPLLITFAGPLLLFIIFGAGLKSGKSQAISKPNFWILFFVLFISGIILLLLNVFPIWKQALGN